MATMGFVEKRIRLLIERFELTLKSSEEELKAAINAALRGEKVTTIQRGNGWSFEGSRGCGIFPEVVKVPQTDEYGNTLWVEDHRWGEGSNENFSTLFNELKSVLVRDAGILGDNVSWETARKWDPDHAREVSKALSATASDRGPGSPYTQDYQKELELGLEFGSDLLLQWHKSMHKKGWAEFVGDIHILWKRWGMEAIHEISEICADKIRWFVEYATKERWQYDNETQQSTPKRNVPESWDHKRALRAWKRSNWIHAICKIDSAKLAEIDEQFGSRQVDEAVRDSKDVVCSLPETHRHLALEIVLSDDSIEWLKDEPWSQDCGNAEGITRHAKQIGLKPSEMAAQVKEVIQKTGLNWGQINRLLVEKIPAEGIFLNIEWPRIRSLALTNADKVSAVKSRSKDIAIRGLYLGDSIEWLTKSPWLDSSEPIWIFQQAQKLEGWLPSQAAEKIEEVSTKAKLAFSDIENLTSSMGWYNAILWPLEFRDDLNEVLAEHRTLAICLHRGGDDVSWLNVSQKVERGERDYVVSWAKNQGRRPSVVADEFFNVIKKAGLNLNLAVNALNGLLWPVVVEICAEFSAEILSATESSRDRCVQLLAQKRERNTRWWPQALNSGEFDAGVEAEKVGREGLSGIQRRRWLTDHLGVSWTPKVDWKISWEKSTEIIQNNPWLKTSLSFVDKEETILSLSSGKNVAYLKYVADQEEYGYVRNFDKKSLKEYWRVISGSWSEDVRGWFNKLAAAVGEQVAWDYIGNRDRHQQLFFAEAAIKKLPVEFLKVALLQVRSDYDKFGQAINAFEPDGTQFQSFKEFVKYTDLQKGQIVFPTGSPEVLRGKVDQMIEAPGVSVSAIREFVRDSKNWQFMTGGEDGKAVFPALRLEFTEEPLSGIVSRALGRRNSSRLEDRAQAESPELLFKKLCKLAKSTGLKGAVDLTREVPAKIYQEVLQLLREHKVVLGKVYVAEILAKSDPRGWVCGDWTVCCMQFGTTKNNEYMRRRDMSYFIISREDRLISQSVVVGAALTNRNGGTPQLATANLKNLDGIALDNVEVAPNFYGETSVVERVYRVFWQQYVQRLGVAECVDVIIGMSHNDAHPAKETTPMAWKPLETMVYSDCFGHSEAYILVRKETKKIKKGEKE